MVDRKGLPRGKAGTKGANKNSADETSQTNHDVVRERLQELSMPILERYGKSAFDELLTRLETTIEEFTNEFETLFNEMIDQSRDDYRRLQSLLTPDDTTDAVEEAPQPEATAMDEMSEFERRLEEMEQDKATQAE